MLVVSEEWVNEDKGYRGGASGWYEPYTEDVGRLFRNMQREYGRCAGHVYIETGGDVVPIGWVFEKKQAYETRWYQREGADGYYMQSTWITLGWKDELAPNDPPFVYDVKRRVPIRTHNRTYALA